MPVSAASELREEIDARNGHQEKVTIIDGVVDIKPFDGRPKLYELIKREIYSRRHLLLEDTDLNDDRWFDRWLYPELFGQKPALILMLNRMGVASVHNLYRGSGQFQILLWDKALLGKPEVGKQVIDKIFSYKLRRLEAAIPTFNRLSIRYAARLGFRKVGYISEDYLRDGRWYDVLLFELLAKDFRR